MRFKERAWKYRFDPLTHPFRVVLALRPMMALRSLALQGERDDECTWKTWCRLMRESPTGRIVLLRQPTQ